MKRNLRVFAQVAILLIVCTFLAAQYLSKASIFCPEGDPSCTPRVPTEKTDPRKKFDSLTTTSATQSSDRPPASLDDLDLTTTASTSTSTTATIPLSTKENSVQDGVPTEVESALQIEDDAVPTTTGVEPTSLPPDDAEFQPEPAPSEATPTVSIEELVRDTLQAIMIPESRSTDELECPAINKDRYGYLDVNNSTYAKPHLVTLGRPKKYFFALDLFQCVPVLPGLMGAIVDVLRYLGPENCVVSIVEGRSEDGTREILEALEKQIVSLGAEYFLAYNDVDPRGPGANRIEALAELRNHALDDIFRHPEHYDPTARIIYINDIVPCAEDILEVLHQHITQEMDQACAMDWINNGDAFYDVWVCRSMTGDIFFEITQGVDWKFSQNLFWDHRTSRERYHARQPTQVYACWNGITVLNAQPFLKQEVVFRFSDEANGECYMGEPTLLAKDLWKKGYNRIAVVPSVNVGYSAFQSNATKMRRGTTRDNVAFAAEEERVNGTLEQITWAGPPGQVKCLPSWEDISWVPPF